MRASEKAINDYLKKSKYAKCRATQFGKIKFNFWKREILKLYGRVSVNPELKNGWND